MNEKALIILSRSGLSLPVQHKWKDEIVKFLNGFADKESVNYYALTDDDIAESLAMHIRKLIKKKQTSDINTQRMP